MDTDPDLIATTARELREQHRVTSHAPQAIAAWQHIDAMAAWLARARACCAAPEPEATKAAEWLLDNDYQVLRSARQIRQDLPRAFYARLPRLAGPEHEALPRVFCLAHGLLRACRLQVSLAAAVRFVQAYQEQSPLTIAELWAFPTMLRLACLELLVAAFARLVPELKPPFALSPCVAMLGPLDDTESVSRALANLGVIASIAWKDFFDSTSQVEAILQGDPAGVYARMDFGTRDRYRKVVEELADDAACSETDVAPAGCRAGAGRGHAAPERARGPLVDRTPAGARWRRHSAIALPRRRRRTAGCCIVAGWLYASALVITGMTRAAATRACTSRWCTRGRGRGRSASCWRCCRRPSFPLPSCTGSSR